jgi:NitT/TauT family transport system ATP-binding protein
VTDTIQIEQAKKVYRSRTGPVHALGPVDLAVQPGEFVSIVGPSGCGKSTLLLMIAGLIDITSGKIIVDGKPVIAPQTDIGSSFKARF